MRPLTLIAACALLAACGSSQKVCTAGASQVCTCASGSEGTQSCLSDETGYGGCTNCGGAGGGAGGGGGSSGACLLPTAPTCGANARCDDTSGTATCVCAAGYQDNDTNGSCEPDCSLAALTCATHAACDDAAGAARCQCTARYDEVDGGCVFGGAPNDPGFEGTPPNAWTVTGDVEHDAGAAGIADPGALFFHQGALCGDGGVATQTLDMPQLSLAEPLAMQVISRSNCPVCRNRWSARWNGGWVDGPTQTSTGVFSQTTCLGERAYGANAALQLSAQATTQGACVSTPTANLFLDRVSVSPLASCPMPGTLPGGDFEGTTAWAPTNGGGGAARVTTDSRITGRGGRLITTQLCQSAALSEQISPPTTGTQGDTAIQLTYAGTGQGSLTVSLGGQLLAELPAVATAQTVRVCVPEWARGMTQLFSLGLPFSSGTCLNPDPRDFVVDEISFVRDPRCAARMVFDGAFDRVDLGKPWVLSASPASSRAIVLQDMAEARTGAGVLQLTVSQPCAIAAAAQTGTVPAAIGAAGPAVRFFTRLPGVSRATFTALVDGRPLLISSSTTWTQQTACLRPVDVGRDFSVRFQASGGSGTCANTYAAETLYIDDVEVTTDPSCPAQ